MDKQMYDLIKTAIKDGKSIDDVVAEVNNMAKTAKKELQPQAPLLEKYFRTADRYVLNVNADDTINKDALVGAIATYFVQNGFNPDVCFDSDKKFRAHIIGILDRGLATSKVAEKVYALEKSGASDGEILEAAFNTLGGWIKDTIADWD